MGKAFLGEQLWNQQEWANSLRKNNPVLPTLSQWRSPRLQYWPLVPSGLPPDLPSISSLWGYEWAGRICRQAGIPSNQGTKWPIELANNSRQQQKKDTFLIFCLFLIYQFLSRCEENLRKKITFFYNISFILSLRQTRHIWTFPF